MGGTGRRGRRPKVLGDTRKEILRAALRVFSTQGFDQATLRGIAREAKVDPSLLLHYFGSKEALFFEAVRSRIFPRMEAVLSALPSQGGPLGERIVRTFLALWDDAQERDVLVALIRAGVSNARVASLVREFFSRELPSRLALGLGGSVPGRRVGLAAAQLIGLAMARYVIQLPEMVSAPPEELVAAVGPTLTRYLTGAELSRRGR